MGPYTTITIAIFLLIMSCLGIMAYTQSYWLIFILGAMIPVLVAIQVWVVLRKREEEAPGPGASGNDWYEHF